MMSLNSVRGAEVLWSRGRPSPGTLKTLISLDVGNIRPFLVGNSEISALNRRRRGGLRGLDTYRKKKKNASSDIVEGLSQEAAYAMESSEDVHVSGVLDVELDHNIEAGGALFSALSR